MREDRQTKAQDPCVLVGVVLGLKSVSFKSLKWCATSIIKVLNA